MRFLLFLLCQTFLRLAFNVTFCERRNWRPFWYNTALSKWESPHFFASFKFRKLHANVFKSAAILPRNGQFVLTTSTNDRTVNQSIPRWCYYTPRSIPMTIFSPFEILSYRREDNTLCNFPSIFEPALKIVLKVADEIQKNTTLKIALTYLKSRRCIALKKISLQIVLCNMHHFQLRQGTRARWKKKGLQHPAETSEFIFESTAFDSSFSFTIYIQYKLYLRLAGHISRV